MKSWHDFSDTDLVFKVIILKPPPPPPVKSAFSELLLLNQWDFLHQICIETLMESEKNELMTLTLYRW